MKKKTIKISQLSRDYTINRTILTYRTGVKNIREFKIAIISILKSLPEKINMKYQVDNFYTFSCDSVGVTSINIPLRSLILSSVCQVYLKSLLKSFFICLSIF